MKFALILLMMGFWNPQHVEREELAIFASRNECEASIKTFPMCGWTNKSCVCSEVSR